MLEPESDRSVDSPVTDERSRHADAVHAPAVVMYCLPGKLDHIPSLVRELSKRVELRVVFEVSRTAWDLNLLGLPRPPFPPGLWPCRDFLREHLPSAVYNDLAGARDLRMAMFETRAGSDVLVTTRAVRRWLRHISPDLIHFDGESVRPLLWLRSVRVPSVVSVHEPRVPSQSSYTQLRIAKRALVKRSKRVVVHSHAAESDLLHTFSIPRDRVAVVPLGVNEVFAQWPVTDPDTTERRADAHVLFFGRLTPRKGLSVFMAAAESVSRQKSHVEFAVAGRPGRGLVPPPPPRLANDCTLTMTYARLAPADVASALRWADIVVAPYLEARQSGVVLTAYAFGKPVVATRVGGLAEQVVDGVTGILVPPGDVSGLAAAMLELLDSPGRRRKMADAIALAAANELSWDRHCERLVCVYAEAIQSASSASNSLLRLRADWARRKIRDWHTDARLSVAAGAAESSVVAGTATVDLPFVLLVGLAYSPTRSASDKVFMRDVAFHVARSQALRPVVVSVTDHIDAAFDCLDSDPDVRFPVWYRHRALHKMKAPMAGTSHAHARHGRAREYVERSLTMLTLFTTLRRFRVVQGGRIVHFFDNFGPLMTPVSHLAGLTCGVTVIGSLGSAQAPARRWLWKESLSRADFVVAGSEPLADEFQRLGVKATVIPWGSHPSDPSSLLAGAEERDLVVWTGPIGCSGLAEFPVAAQALAAFAESCPDASVVVWPKPEFVEVCEPVAGRWKLAVDAPGARFPQLLTKVRILVSPIADPETIVGPPLTWLEAIADGATVVTTPCRGVSRELLESGRVVVAADFTSRAVERAMEQAWSRSADVVAPPVWTSEDAAAEYVDLWRSRL